MTRLWNTPVRCWLDRLFLLILVFSACGPSSRQQAPPEVPGMVYIKGGTCSIGLPAGYEPKLSSSFGFKKPFFQNQKPRHKIFFKSFYLDRHEVTVGQYQEFLRNTGRRPPRYWSKLDPVEFSRYPVNGVSWHDADAYARWAGKRLPSEREWEAAAAGKTGRKFPWGNSFIRAEERLKKNDLFPVETTPFDITPRGIHDLGGSVSEWTSSWYRSYPGNNAGDDDYGEKYKVYRGGAWGVPGHYRLPRFYRVTFRGFGRPDQVFNEVGFRCARDGL
ncbi:MAG: formylglycine-generating enzyme family protein [bacterium]